MATNEKNIATETATPARKPRKRAPATANAILPPGGGTNAFNGIQGLPQDAKPASAPERQPAKKPRQEKKLTMFNVKVEYATRGEDAANRKLEELIRETAGNTEHERQEVAKVLIAWADRLQVPPQLVLPATREQGMKLEFDFLSITRFIETMAGTPLIREWDKLIDAAVAARMLRRDTERELAAKARQYENEFVDSLMS